MLGLHPRVFLRLVCLAFLIQVSLQAQTLPATDLATRERIVGYPRGSGDVTTPGFHKLVYHWTGDGRPRYMPFSLCLPQGYGQPGRRFPMLTFLAGLGDRGTDPGMAMSVGVPLEIGQNNELAKWMPMIVLTPQCPSNKVWDTPGVAQDVLKLLRAVSARFAVDETRLYLTGFSDGGKGTWAVAAAEPKLFAAIAPIVSREYAATETAGRLAQSGVSCLIISGQNDPKSEPASTNMAAAMRQQNIDVTHAIMPGAGHFIWRNLYCHRDFYQWLLLHQKGAQPPADRPGPDLFVKLFQSRQHLSVEQQVFDHRIQRDLDRLEPYWFIDNCAMNRQVGLRPVWQGRRNVLATHPLTGDIPCRLQTTRQLPAGRTTDLLIEVGNLPQSEWELIVRVNEEEQLRKQINDASVKDGWLQVKLSLAPWTGKEARLQLIHASTAVGPAIAYWSQLKLVETPQ